MISAEINHLRHVTAILRITGACSFIFTFANAILFVALLFIFSLNKRFFGGTGTDSFRNVEIEKSISMILVFACVFLILALASLYMFEQLRSRALIIVGEIYDEVGWHTERKSTGNDLGLSERIALKTASQSAALPFLSTNQGSILYVGIAFLLFFPVVLFATYLLQSLPNF